MSDPSRRCWNSNPDKWEKVLSQYLSRTRVELISRPKRLNNKSRIITRCIHGDVNRACGSLELAQSCCKKGSKDGIPSTNSTPKKWEKVLCDYIERTGVTLVHRPDRLTAKSKIVTRCPHGEVEKFCETLEHSTFCCRKHTTFHGFRVEEKKKPAKIYLVEYFDDGGLHYKLGITRNPLKKRLRSKLFKSIKTWDFSLEKCFHIEQKALRFAETNGWRYRSSTTTELIHQDGLFKIIDYIDSLV